jgi:hypothetical protein
MFVEQTLRSSHLVPQLLGREPCPALRVAGCHEQVEQIAELAGMGFGLKALGHDLVNQPDPAPPEPSPRPIARCRDGLVNLSAWEPFGRVMPDSKPLKVHSWLKP